jgi:uncharacterized protein YcaQ
MFRAAFGSPGGNSIESGATDESAANQAWKEDCKYELKAYKKEKGLPVDERNFKEQAHQVLIWWDGKRHKYPILHKVATRVLAIPATEAPSERLFSLASRVITKTRNRLKPDIVAAIIMIQENSEVLQKHYQDITRRISAPILPGTYKQDTNDGPENGAEITG